MRTVLVLLVLALAGGGAYYYFAIAGPQAGGGDGTVDLNLDGDGFDLTPGEVPENIQSLRQQADDAWNAAGVDRLTTPRAVEIAAMYAEVLMGLYSVDGTEAEQRELIETRLRPLGDALFFSRTPFTGDSHGIFGTHAVSSGESPARIAPQYGMSYQYLNLLRGREPNDAALRVGETLKIVNARDNGGYFIHVDKSDFTLDLFIAGIFVRRYNIAHGSANTPTPTGRASITEREWHPSWRNPETNQNLRYGEPGHILGPVWIELDEATIGVSGIGIHGWGDANSDAQIGSRASRGCIRMQNSDAIEVFNILPQVGHAPMEVRIVD